MTVGDYGRFDMIIAMDSANLYNMRRFVNGDPEKKVSLMMSHCGKDKDVADPWYTGNFDDTWDDVLQGCRGILEKTAK